MKVSITKRTKECILASQLSAAKAVVESCKEDEWGAKEWAQMAADLLLDENNTKVFCASASVMPNSRVYDAFGACEDVDGTGNLDVWIDFAAQGFWEFIEAGCYLTDLWNLNSDNREEVKSHMYCVRYKKQR